MPLVAPGFVKLNEGDTVSNATRDSSISTGDRKAKRISKRLVRESAGARYWLMNLESP